jgi:prepilin-type N-terminal cleavage/methylation domain-containing protein
MQHVPRGFTLLELMVVLVIIGICTAGIGLGLGSLLDPRRQLRQEANGWRSACRWRATRPASMAAPALAGRRRRLPLQPPRRHPLG